MQIQHQTQHPPPPITQNAKNQKTGRKRTQLYAHNHAYNIHYVN